MVERIDDWALRWIEEQPGQYKISFSERYQPGKECRVIEKSLTISEAMDLHDVGARVLRYIARTFR